MRAVIPFGPYRGQGPRRVLDNVLEAWRRVPWPPPAPAGESRPVAAVTVSYNTRELTGHLLYSLLRVLPGGRLSRIVVVDNDSRDGSRALLTAMRDQGLIDLVDNRRLTYHGPGLNRGLSYLARLQRRGEADTGLVWTLDSDVVVLRPDVVDAAAAALASGRGALAGEMGPEEPALLPMGCMYVSSMLLDPARVWKRGVRPFWEHGTPSAGMQLSLRHRGERLVEFPFYRDRYLLHLGHGTSDGLVQRNETDNRYYRWASAPRSYTHHYAGNPDGARQYDGFLERFRDDVPVLTAEALAEACTRPERVTFGP